MDSNSTNSNSKSLQPFLLGITGSIGTGKSLVGEILKEYSIFVIDTDNLVKEIMSTKNKVTQKIVEEFGGTVISGKKDEYIDKKKLAKIVFEDGFRLKKLESIIHPEVLKLLTDLVNLNKEKSLIAALIPLLFECNLESYFNEKWCVKCDREIQMQRLLSRGYTNKEANDRINAQFTQDEKAKRSDFVIDNSKSKDYTKEQIVKRLKLLVQSNHNFHLSFDK